MHWEQVDSFELGTIGLAEAFSSEINDSKTFVAVPASMAKRAVDLVQFAAYYKQAS